MYNEQVYGNMYSSTVLSTALEVSGVDVNIIRLIFCCNWNADFYMHHTIQEIEDTFVQVCIVNLDKHMPSKE